MSARTFYLAAASSNVEVAKARISDLESMGLRCLYNWTALDKPEGEWRQVAEDEHYAIKHADLFVIVAPLSPGSGWEGGYRLRGESAVHVVGEWSCPFAHDPLVVRHATWEQFLATLSGAA